MIIRRGDRNQEVKELQERLSLAGYLLEPDGIFGLHTEAAVRSFQRKSHLLIDGIVGNNTWNMLLKAPVSSQKQQVIRSLHRVPYFTQRDNKNNPYGTCGPTSISMVLSYLGIVPSEGLQLEDEIWNYLESPEGQEYFEQNFPWAIGKYHANNVAGMLKWVVETKYNLQDSLKILPWTQVKQILSQGPLVTSGQFTGSGHVVCLIGLTVDEDPIFHDPYGNWEQGYSRNQDGRATIYTKEKVLPILKPSGEKPYVHIITKTGNSG